MSRLAKISSVDANTPLERGESSLERGDWLARLIEMGLVAAFAVITTKFVVTLRGMSSKPRHRQATSDHCVKIALIEKPKQAECRPPRRLLSKRKTGPMREFNKDLSDRAILMVPNVDEAVNQVAHRSVTE